INEQCEAEPQEENQIRQDATREWIGSSHPRRSTKSAVRKLPNLPRPAPKKINQDKLGQVARVSEISLAIGHGAHLFYKIDQVVVAGQHEGVDHDTGLATRLYFLEGLRHNERIAAHRVLIKAPRLIRRAGFFNSRTGETLHETRGRLAVGNHHDLLHLLALRLEQSARETQTFRGVRVIWTNLRGR